MDTDPFRDPALKQYVPIPAMKIVKRTFRLLDIYAIPITLRYKGEKKFYTNFGALTSLVLIITMIGFAISYILTMIADTQIA